jgi:hypothetical protein
MDETRPPDQFPQQVVAGYDILEELGRGGMGIVYKARHRALNRIVALKMILAGGHAGAEDRLRFKLEAEAVARLDHPNIVRIFDVGEQDGRPFFSLEYVDGGSLSRKLDGSPMVPREAARLAEQIARGIQAAHETGIIHRDLKPANVLLSAERGAQSAEREVSSTSHSASSAHRSSEVTAKITDFGLAKHLDADGGHGQTQSGSILGTHSYMAPEQAAGHVHAISPATDVYALGAILYEMLTGRAPFKAASVVETLEQVRQRDPVPPSRLQPRLPRDLETICIKCLEKEPRRRYASAQDAADDLKRFLSNEAIKARPASPLERAVKWARRCPTQAALAVVVAMAIIILGVVWVDFTARVQIERDAAQRERRRADGQRTEAEDARKLAERARGQAQTALKESRQAQMKLHLSNGLRLGENGDLLGALPSLAEALRLDQGNAEHERLLRLRLGMMLEDCPRLERAWTTGEVSRSVFSLDGQRLATATRDGAIRVWDVVTGQALPLSIPYGTRVAVMRFSRDGNRLLVAGDDYAARLWNLNTGKPITEPMKSDHWVHDAVFTRDGKMIATASHDHTVRLWDTATGKAIGKPLWHTACAEVVQFSADGKWLVSRSGRERTVRVWNVETGQEAYPPLRHATGYFALRWLKKASDWLWCTETTRLRCMTSLPASRSA